MNEHVLIQAGPALRAFDIAWVCHRCQRSFSESEDARHYQCEPTLTVVLVDIHEQLRVIADALRVLVGAVRA